jgi:hypothetical protein
MNIPTKMPFYRLAEKLPADLCHPSGFVPGPIRRGCRNDSEPTSETRFGLVVARRQPTRSRTTVNDTASAARPDAHETRSDIDWIAVAETSTTGTRLYGLIMSDGSSDVTDAEHSSFFISEISGAHRYKGAVLTIDPCDANSLG